MYTNSGKKMQNKRAIYFLIILSVFGFACFKFTKTKIVNGNDENPESCTTTVDNSPQETLTVFNALDDGTIVDVSPEKVTKDTSGVLGASSGTCTTNKLYQAGVTCAESNNGFSADGKNFVASEIEIEMSVVNAPLVILSGSSKSAIKDSNRDLTSDSPIYKPGGEQFTVNQALIYTAPGEESQTMKEKLTTGVETKTNFGTKYNVSTSESDANADGEVVINKYVASDCVECNNPSNPTPEKSNTIAKLLKGSSNYPNQEKIEAAEEAQATTITIDKMCEDKQDIEMGSISTPACVSTWNVMAGALASLFPSSSWGSCDPENDDNCISSGSLVVKMSPMFKETNAYMEARNKKLVDPKSSSTYGATYVMTPCKAVIKKKGTDIVMASVSVKCAWDLSYLFFERDAAENDDNPGSHDTPSKEAYMEYLEKDSSARAGSLTSL